MLSEKETRRKNYSLKGSSQRPRATVFRSNKAISIQVIDDAVGKTLVSVTTLKVKEKVAPIAKAEMVGKELATLLKAKKIKEIIFDRNGYKYHGQVKAIAETMRQEGIVF